MSTSNRNSIYKKSNHDLNQLVDNLNNILNNSFIKSCPKTFIRNKKRLSWRTKEIDEAEIELIKRRNDLETDPNDSLLQSRYNEAHTCLKTLLNRESNNNWKAFCTGLQKQKKHLKNLQISSGKQKYKPKLPQEIRRHIHRQSQRNPRTTHEVPIYNYRAEQNRTEPLHRQNDICSN